MRQYKTRVFYVPSYIQSYPFCLLHTFARYPVEMRPSIQQVSLNSHSTVDSSCSTCDGRTACQYCLSRNGSLSCVNTLSDCHRGFRIGDNDSIVVSLRDSANIGGRGNSVESSFLIGNPFRHVNKVVEISNDETPQRRYGSTLMARLSYNL